MTKEHLQITEAFDKFNNVLNARLRFFIGGAIKDALVLGNRTNLLKEDEAQALLDVLEAEILTDARKADEVRTFLGDSPQPQPAEQGEDDEMTPRQYFELFLSPALDIIKEELAEKFGGLFIAYICTGKRPAEDELSEGERLLWNAFLAVVQIRFNAELTAAITDDEA